MALIKKPVNGMKDILPDEMALRTYVINLIRQTYASYGQNYVDLCKQSAMNQMGDFDISQMLGGLLGGSI